MGTREADIIAGLSSLINKLGQVQNGTTELTRAEGLLVAELAGWFQGFSKGQEKSVLKHVPQRGSDVEEYIKTKRDEYDRVNGDSYEHNTWCAFDSLLDDYREHADTGTPLDQELTGPH